VGNKEEKLKQRHEQFFRLFVVPLVIGGEMRIGLPVNREEGELFLMNHHSEEVKLILSAVDEARERSCLEWTRSRLALPILQEDPETLILACAVYNLLFMSHPVAERWGTGGSLEKLTEFTHELLERVPEPTTLRAAMAYYSLLRGLFDLYRTDIEVRWWVGKEEFHGTMPPKRLLYWKSVRRVTENVQRTSWLSFQLNEQQGTLWKALLRKSPLTNLTLPTRRWPLELHDSIVSLEDGDLWRGLSSLYLKDDVTARASELCVAFWYAAGALKQEKKLPSLPTEGAQPRVSQLALRRIAQFIYHLCALGLYLRGEGLLNQLTATLSQENNAAGDDLSPHLVLLTFAALYDTEMQHHTLKVPKELRGESSSALDKSIQLWRKVVGQTNLNEDHQKRVLYLASVL
jgi:hypothetical protein